MGSHLIAGTCRDALLEDASYTDADLSRDCVADDEIVAFADGSLSPTRLAAINEHLGRCQACMRLAIEAAHALQPGPERDLRDAFRPVSLVPGTLLTRRYLIERFVARGGMGEIYEATDQLLRERVAVKTLLSTASDNPLLLRKLLDEASLARRVSHPNVCRIHNLEVDRDVAGQPIHFLIMEYIAGSTLGNVLREGSALSLADATCIARQLASALQAAHQAHVLHLDLKSNNIILRHGQSLQPVIVDFGLARCTGLDEEEAPRRYGSLEGSVGYMAPEQCAQGILSPATDIYALGVILFEMLTGRLPFTGATRNARIAAPPGTDPPRPSDLRSELPAALDRIVLHCMRYEAERRYQSATELLAQLEQLHT